MIKIKDKYIRKIVIGSVATAIISQTTPINIFAMEDNKDILESNIDKTKVEEVIKKDNDKEIVGKEDYNKQNINENQEVNIKKEELKKDILENKNTKEVKVKEENKSLVNLNVREQMNTNTKASYGYGYMFETTYSNNKNRELKYNLSTGEDIKSSWSFNLNDGMLSEWAYTFTEYTEKGDKYTEFTKLPMIVEDSQNAFILEYSTDGVSFSTTAPDVKNLVAFRLRLNSIISSNFNPELRIEYNFKPVNIPKSFIGTSQLIIGGYSTDDRWGNDWVNPSFRTLINFYESNTNPEIITEDKTIKVGDSFNPLDGVTAKDKEDGNLTNKIKVVENTVNTNKTGSYTVKYEVTDSQGATSTKTITVTVNPKMSVINAIPTIEAENKTIKKGDTFNPLEGVIATDKEDGNISKNIKVIENDVNTSKEGVYTVKYEVVDSKGAKATKTITVTVKSNAKPVISGADNINIKEGISFDPMLGVTAKDKEDGNITNKIKATGAVEVDKPGKYNVIYSVTDSDGNTSTVKRIVTVNPKMIVTNNAPVINANNKTLNLGERFNPLEGVNASDKEDGDLTKDIKVIENMVDTSKAGTYKVVYEVTDKQGAKATKTIIVTVIANNKPVVNETNNLVSNGNSNISSVNNPKTGDLGSVGYIGMAAAALTGLFVNRKNKKDK